MAIAADADSCDTDNDYIAITDRRIRWRPNAVDPRTDSINDAPFTIVICDDDETEPDEYFEVRFIVETTGYAFPDAIARVTILDDDGNGRNWEGGSP